MRTIANKTQRMLELESQHNKPIEEVLRIMWVDEAKSIDEIASALDISYVTVLKWIRLSAIYSRRIKMEEG